MKLIPYDAEKLKWRKPGTNQALINEFLESEEKCVKVENFTQKSAKIAQSNITTCARKMGIRSMKATIRGNDLFLVKIDM